MVRSKRGRDTGRDTRRAPLIETLFLIAAMLVAASSALVAAPNLTPASGAGLRQHGRERERGRDLFLIKECSEGARQTGSETQRERDKAWVSRENGRERKNLD